jgi:N-acetylneuraminic acid mutarotase
MGAIAFSWENRGFVGFGHDYNAAHPFNDISAFDPRTMKWEEISWLDSGFRTHAFCFVLGDEVYIGGGTRDSGQTALSDFYKYNLRINVWTPLNTLPFSHAFGSRAVVCNGVGYVLGGCTTNGCEEELWQYDAVNDAWLAKQALPIKSQFAIAFVLANEIYYGLGSAGSLHTYSGIWKLNPDSANWRRVRSFTQSGRMQSLGIAIDSTHALAGTGFLLTDYSYQGGSTYIRYGSGPIYFKRPETDYMKADFWLYNAVKDRWKQLPSQKRGRRGAVSFIIDNYLYTGMGNAENKLSKDVYRLNLSSIR